MKSIDIAASVGKWLLLQYVLLALMPYFFEGIYGDGLLVLMFLYTTSYATYWEYVPKEKRVAWIFAPYLVYLIIAVALCFIVDEWHLSLWLCVLWPLYGLGCFFGVKYVKRWYKQTKSRYRYGGAAAKFAIALLFIALKCICVSWECLGQGSFDGEKKKLLDSLCRTMNRRICESKAMNLPTYPGEAVYVPDMLVAIVALNEYADLYGGKYRSTVKRWTERAKKEWLDEGSGLLVSFLKEDGSKYDDSFVKGSYSALNCYYLTFIDKTFARKQYDTLKRLFWKDSWVRGLKEYWDRCYYFGLDIDAGFILFELSPSGTAFLAGPATYFGDTQVRSGILKTAEVAGHTVGCGDRHHYLLGNVALVGEAIMLAMRTHRGL